jgi:nitroreductase
MKDLIESLNWRYATKKYDPEKKLIDAQLEILLEAARLAPTSFGLQPFRIIIVADPEVRAKLRAAGYGQSPITDASHFLVFAVKTDLGIKTVDEFIALTASVRNKPNDSFNDYHKMILGAIANNTPEQNSAWAARQAYIALGTLLTAAAMNEIDTTPMEGFDHKGFDDVLGLEKLNLTAVAAVAIGFRAADDGYAQLKKVRFPKDKFFIEIK